MVLDLDTTSGTAASFTTPIVLLVRFAQNSSEKVTLGTTESSASRKIVVLNSSYWMPDMTSDTEMVGMRVGLGVGV